MIDDKAKDFISAIPSIRDDTTGLFDLMLTCYLRGRADESKAEGITTIDRLATKKLSGNSQNWRKLFNLV